MPWWSLKFNRKSKTNEVSSLLKVIISQCNIFRTFKLKHWSGKREEKARLAVCNFSSDVLITQKHAISSPSPSSYGHSIYALKIPIVLIFRRPLEIALFISQTGRVVWQPSWLNQSQTASLQLSTELHEIEICFYLSTSFSIVEIHLRKKVGWEERKTTPLWEKEKPTH